MNDKKRSESVPSDYAAELERLEHARKIVIEVLDKGILGLHEAGTLAIDLSRRSAEVGACGCHGKCGCKDVCGCHSSCPQAPCPITTGTIEQVVQPGEG
jgi:hypothetical protein